MSDSKMREEFEAWARKMSMDLEYRNVPGVGQFYECPRTLLALEAWRASRAAVVTRVTSLGLAPCVLEEVLGVLTVKQ